MDASRATVRRLFVRSATKFAYGCNMKPRLETAPWRSEFDGILAENEIFPRCERLMLLQIFEDFRDWVTPLATMLSNGMRRVSGWSGRTGWLRTRMFL